MDPKAALELADQAISDLDPETANEALIAYFDWRNHGGFEPADVAGSGKSGDAFAQDCNRRLEDLVRAVGKGEHPL